jgi:hypothetical protein
VGGGMMIANLKSFASSAQSTIRALIFASVAYFGLTGFGLGAETAPISLTPAQECTLAAALVQNQLSAPLYYKLVRRTIAGRPSRERLNSFLNVPPRDRSYVKAAAEAEIITSNTATSPEEPIDCSVEFKKAGLKVDTAEARQAIFHFYQNPTIY